MKHSKTPFKSLTANKDTENRKILKALIKHKQPLTRRFLSEVTGLELPTLCRALHNLTYKRKLLKIAQIKVCATTGKKVYHYYLLDDLKLGGLK